MFRNAFRENRYFAALINEDEFYGKYYLDDKYRYKQAKKELLKSWGSYYTLYTDGQLYMIEDKSFLEKIHKKFEEDENKELNESTSTTSSRKYLKDFGAFLTEKEYETNPAVGRDSEIEELELALITPDKSAIIVGEAGVGKTAIVEGLAYKIKKGLVPEKLKDYEIVSINTSSLIAGCSLVGMVEERITNIMNELKNNKKIIMFIDEIHTVIGAGAGSKSNLDVANILKPNIDRGDIKIIGSTTFDEYNNLMLDTAFKRRFKKINVYEPDNNMIINILDSNVIWLEKYYNVKFDFNSDDKNIIYNNLLDVTSKASRDVFDKINNPDLILSILKEAFARASLHNHESIQIEDIKNAILSEERIYDTSRERVALKLERDLANNNVKKLSKVIQFSRNKK